MNMLAQDRRTVFLGQAVCYPGTAMTNTLAEIPSDRKIEMPVFEETQMGISIGLALAGQIPVSIFPRWNFLLLAANQLVNHLDKLPLISKYRPHVIIRVGVGSVRPLDPQHQHRDDFTDAFRAMCKTVSIRRLHEPEDIFPSYRHALATPGAHVLVEFSDYLNEK